MKSNSSYRDLKYPIAGAPLYMRRQRRGFTTVIRDTYLTHMLLVSAVLNYLSASKQTLYDTVLNYATEGTLLFHVVGVSARGRTPMRQTIPQSPFLTRRPVPVM
jgi:hypothetical protein